MKKKIAILGGGIGGCAAAYWLTHPDQKGRYEVTLYQQGWRLGGKGASGRNLDPAMHHRSEEHGLHIWLGFYENAFHLLRDAYENIAPNGEFACIGDAFTAQKQGIIAQREGVIRDFDPKSGCLPMLGNFQRLLRGNSARRDPKTGWDFWVYDFPQSDFNSAGEPWKSGDGKDLPGLDDYATRSFMWMLANAKSLLGLIGDFNGLATIIALLQGLLNDLGLLPKTAAELTPAHRRILADAVAALHGLRDLLHLIISVNPSLPGSASERARLFQVLDLALTCIIGAFKDGVLDPPFGFDKLDDKEFCNWLEDNGAKYFTLDSGPVKGLYDLPFAYAGGVTEKVTEKEGPNLAAGVAVRSLMRIFFGYKGAFVFKMNAGMGETVFTPIYELLKSRGVNFEFFHRVTDLGLSADGTALANFTVVRQALPNGGSYYPLHHLALANGKEFRVWPDRPLADRLMPGTVLPPIDEPGFESSWCAVPVVDSRTLEVGPGKNYEAVVLAISIDGRKYVAPTLSAQNRRS